MERVTPVRKPNASSADLLTWSENPPATPPEGAKPARSHQPSDGIRKVVFGGQVTEEESQSLMQRKPCSGNKMREMTGSGIFADNEGNDSNRPDSKPPTSSKTGIRIHQQTLTGMSQISFGDDDNVTPKKPTTITEVAKQRELSGNLLSESDSKTKRQISNAKCKELSGNDIFGPPPENQPRSLAAVRSQESKDRTPEIEQPARRNVRTSVKVSNPAGGQSNILFGEEAEIKTTPRKLHNQKFQELSGNNIFNGDEPVPTSAEKSLSQAKLREMSGSNIFADGGGKVEPRGRDYFGGVRKPPGGESSISLI